MKKLLAVIVLATVMASLGACASAASNLPTKPNPDWGYQPGTGN
ncbi:MAG: hypothetical protein M0037_12545 [Betaproteobacteria bacterium]|nr:hypothetical protein [Betaproteobacteria bacterium]